MMSGTYKKKSKRTLIKRFVKKYKKKDFEVYIPRNSVQNPSSRKIKKKRKKKKKKRKEENKKKEKKKKKIKKRFVKKYKKKDFEVYIPRNSVQNPSSRRI